LQRDWGVHRAFPPISGVTCRKTMSQSWVIIGIGMEDLKTAQY
jgi:hypothetical protein